MSAIFGIVDKRGRPPGSTEIAGMKERLAHHAVDGRAYYLHDNCFLGHHQLITNRHQQREQLPLKEDHLVITAYARLDNREQLAKQLGIKSAPTGVSDSHLILEAFRHWGKQCVTHFEGEFTFVILNEADHRIFGACDHIATRSFYYYDSPEQFIFASEPKGVLAAKPGPHVFDDEEFYVGMTKDYSAHTFVQGVRLLPSGHTVSVSQSGPAQLEQYWRFQVRGHYAFSSNAEWGECLRDLLEKFLRNKLETDGKAGILLSGGLDSSFIAAVAAKVQAEQNKPLYAFSARLADDHPGTEKDERYFQDLLGKHLPNLEHIYVQPGSDLGPFSDFDVAADQTDGIPNLYHYLDTALCQRAKSYDVKILLNGFMGDLMISRHGRDVLYNLFSAGKWKQAQELFRLMQQNYSIGALPLLKEDVFRHFSAWKALRRMLNLLIAPAQFEGFNPEITAEMMKRMEKGTFTQGDTREVKLAAVNEGIFGQIGQVFQARMAWFGLEMGTPFMSKDLLEFYADVPDEVFLSRGFRRGLIREGMEGLVPPEVQWRTGKSMYTPDFVSRLLRQEPMIEHILSSEEYRPYRSIADVSGIRKVLARLKADPVGEFQFHALGAIVALMAVCALKNFGERRQVRRG